MDGAIAEFRNELVKNQVLNHKQLLKTIQDAAGVVQKLRDAEQKGEQRWQK